MLFYEDPYKWDSGQLVPLHRTSGLVDVFLGRKLENTLKIIGNFCFVSLLFYPIFLAPKNEGIFWVLHGRIHKKQTSLENEA